MAVCDTDQREFKKLQKKKCRLENRTLMLQRKVRKLVRIILQKVLCQKEQIINTTDRQKEWRLLSLLVAGKTRQEEDSLGRARGQSG